MVAVVTGGGSESGEKKVPKKRTGGRPKKSSHECEEENKRIIAGLDIVGVYKRMGVEFSGAPREDVHPCWAVDRPHGNQPSAFVSTNSGRYSDSGGGSKEGLSLWEFAAKYGTYSNWQEARAAFAAEAGVDIGEDLSASNSSSPEDTLEFLEWNSGNETFAYRWCKNFKPGATVEAIKAAGGMMAWWPKNKAKHWQTRVVAIPCYAPQSFSISGASPQPVAWQYWNAGDKELVKYLGKNKQPKRYRVLSTGKTQNTLMGLHGLSRLASTDSGSIAVVWKVAGPSDMLTLYAAIPPEHRDSHLVITNASGERGSVSPQMANMLRGQFVVVAHDADESGRIGGMKWLRALNGVASSVRQLILPFQERESGGLDLRDFLNGVSVTS